jgi:hypothetical protein
VGSRGRPHCPPPPPCPPPLPCPGIVKPPDPKTHAHLNGMILYLPNVIIHNSLPIVKLVKTRRARTWPGTMKSPNMRARSALSMEASSSFSRLSTRVIWWRPGQGYEYLKICQKTPLDVSEWRQPVQRRQAPTAGGRGV